MTEAHEDLKVTIVGQAIDSHASAPDGSLSSDVYSQWSDGKITRETHVYRRDGVTDIEPLGELSEEQLKNYRFDWEAHTVSLVKKQA